MSRHRVSVQVMVGAGPTLAQIHALQDDGWSVPQIAATSGASLGWIESLLYPRGRHQDRVSLQNARAIASVAPCPHCGAKGRRPADYTGADR